MTFAPTERWFHTIELPDGSATPGVFDMRGVARFIDWPQTLNGARCLDVGTCDGFWAFEMERRGAAEVVAIDSDERNSRRFALARAALGSRAERLSCSVYDLDPRVHGQFDVVFCGTLLMHLNDPLHALERLRGVCRGELVLLEGVDAFLDTFAPHKSCASRSAVRGQWWRANTAGLAGALDAAGFDVLSVSRRFVTPFGDGLTLRRRWRWLRPLTGALVKWPRLSSAWVLRCAYGVAFGTYDVVLRARPKS